MRNYLFLVLALASLIHRSLEITTIHHDKPEGSSISVMATSMTAEKEISNVTLTNSERQKRLLPYVNFYQAQNINKPSNQVYNEKYQQYPKKIYLYNDYQQPNSEVFYQKIKYNPFNENNAIPGPFKPMQAAPQRIKVQYVPIPQKVPNFSELYDKLSQLKLSQNYRRPTYVQIKRPVQQETYVLKPQLYNRHKLLQATKTTVETYTPTNIDIPSGPEENFNQYPENKPYVNSQIAVEVPYSSIPEEQYQQVRKPFIIIPASPQEDKQYYIVQRKPVNKKPVPYEVPKYVQVAPQQEEQYQTITPQYEDFPRYQAPPKYENPPKYDVVSNPQPPPKYEEIPPKYAVVSNPQPPPKYEEIPPKYAVVSNPQPPPKYEEIPQKFEEDPKYQSSSSYVDYAAAKNVIDLATILKHLQATNTLPKTLTPDNIDNSIRTLVKILNSLKKQPKTPKPIVVQEEPAPDYIEDVQNEAGVGISGHPNELPGGENEAYPEDTDEGGTPGKPGVDYPALSSIPQTSFNCKTQRYKGFFGDPDTHCQVWHYCDLNGGQASFLCPNGTIFSQVALTCDWWYNVKCSSTAQLYVLNERLYKYIIPLSPKFPEDYTGPLVDKYLALKFQEMEDKMRKEKKGKGNEEKEESAESSDAEDVAAENTEKVATVEMATTRVSKIHEKETLDTVEEDNLQ